MEWSGIECSFIAWFCKKRMEWNGIGWYPFHPISSVKPIFIPPNLKCIQFNGTH